MLVPLLGSAGCGDSGNSAPIAHSLVLAAIEDVESRGQLSGTDPERSPIRYALRRAPSHGIVTVDSQSGAFTYFPAADYFGTDEFTYTVSDGKLESRPATVSIQIANVNDPPTIAGVPPQTNSPETREITIALDIKDVDGDNLEISAKIDDAQIVDAQVNASERTLVLTALRVGTALVTVSASDNEYTATTEVQFSAAEVSKTASIADATPASDAIRIDNSSTEVVDFQLTHNGWPIFDSLEAVVTHIRAMPDRFKNEPLERKIWRFVRDNTYHEVPLSTAKWLHAPLVVLNSSGSGFCSHVSSTLVWLARTAGFEARVWGLSGHVVPEVLVDGQWHMLDPDLSVYYFNESGKVAGVEDLVQNPSLITSPINPIFNTGSYTQPYSSVIANLYASDDNNFLGESAFVAPDPAYSARIVLPPGASFTYPGRWTDIPMGVDGTTPYPIRQFRQASLNIPAGWVGTLPLALQVWDVQGSGLIRLEGSDYVVGSDELRSRIQSAERPITSIEIANNLGLSFVFFLNAMNFEMKTQNEVIMKGLRVWGLHASNVQLPPEHYVEAVNFRKSQPDILDY